MISEWRPVRASLALLLLAIAVFAAAFTVQNAFLPDVVAVADTDEPRSFWLLQAAFLLQTLENIAGFTVLLALAAAVAYVVGRRIGSFSSMPRQ